MNKVVLHIAFLSLISFLFSCNGGASVATNEENSLTQTNLNVPVEVEQNVGSSQKLQEVLSTDIKEGKALINKKPVLTDLKDFIRYTLKNPVKTSYQEEGVQYFLEHKPKELYAAKDWGSTEVSKSSIDSIVDSYGNNEYFVLKIRHKDYQADPLKLVSPTGKTYQDKVQYAAFKYQKDFRLLTSTDTVAPSSFHYERDYGVTPFATFSIGFPVDFKKDKIDDDVVLVINDELFERGRVKMRLEKEKINDIPKLELK